MAKDIINILEDNVKNGGELVHIKSVPVIANIILALKICGFDIDNETARQVIFEYYHLRPFDGLEQICILDIKEIISATGMGMSDDTQNK